MTNNARRSRMTYRKAATSSARMRQSFVSMLNARRELKYYEYVSAGDIPADGGMVYPSQVITQGDTDTTRDGSIINIKDLYLRLELLLHASQVNDFCRVILFTDSQANGVYPVTTDILTAADPNAAYSRLVVVTKRFKILHDKSFALSISGNSRVIQYQKRLPQGNRIVNYLGPTSAESANGKGAIYALLIGDQVSNFTTFNISVASSFYDS